MPDGTSTRVSIHDFVNVGPERLQMLLDALVEVQQRLIMTAAVLETLIPLATAPTSQELTTTLHLIKDAYLGVSRVYARNARSAYESR